MSRLLTLLRKKGSFLPTDLSGLALWLDASDLSTITESSGAVSQWDDKSGNARHATQGNALNQPATGTATLNNKNALSYDGGDYLGTGVFLANAAVATFFVVYEHASENFALIGGDTSSYYIGLAAAGDANVAVNNGFAVSSFAKNGTSVSAPATRGDAYTGFAGGPNIATVVATNTSGAARGFFPLSWVFVSFSPVAKVAEFLVYTGALSAAETDSVETYLAAKWGVTLA